MTIENKRFTRDAAEPVDPEAEKLFNKCKAQWRDDWRLSIESQEIVIREFMRLLNENKKD